MDSITPINIPIEKNSYILKDALPDRAYDLLLNMMDNGFKGLCVTRTNPGEVKKRYAQDFPVVWLTNQKSKDFLTSININELKLKVKSFIKKNKKSVVLLDRFDYLINMHGFNNVLKFVYALNDEVSLNNSVLMFNVNPNTLSPRELSLLEQELKSLPKQKAEIDSELPDDLHEILVFVNNNEKVSFKRVSKEFSITKTTTRKRINSLLEKNMVTVKKNGRNKIVRITDSARGFL